MSRGLGDVYKRQDPRRGYLVMTLTLPLFTFLSMVSKENGILLPVVIGALEITVFSAQRQRYGVLDKRWAGLFLVAPLAIISVYLGRLFFEPNFLEIVPPRDFSVFERLLTQPRIIVDYLQNWFIPKLYTTGVFQDHFLKSTGLFTPVSTFLSIILVIGSLAIAAKVRRRAPLVAAAILFYFANHLLESTVVSLELYFEHRNYLATALLFVPLVALLWERASRRVFAIASLALLLMLGGFTRYSSTVWQSEEGMVQASAMKAPTSVRAQSQYAMLLFNANMNDEGMRVLDAAIENIPGDQPALLMHKLTSECNMGVLEPAELEHIAGIVSSIPFDPRMLKIYNEFAKAVVLQRCPDIRVADVLPMFVNMLALPENQDKSSIQYTHIRFLIGYTRLYMGEVNGAMAEFKESLASRPGASYAMAMAALFATSGFPAQALELSEIALTQLDTKNTTTLVGQRATEADIRAFQETVRAELALPQGADIPDQDE